MPTFAGSMGTYLQRLANQFESHRGRWLAPLTVALLAFVLSAATFDEVTKSRPEKGLLQPLTKSGGRNNTGRITSRRRGGGLPSCPLSEGATKGATTKGAQRKVRARPPHASSAVPPLPRRYRLGQHIYWNYRTAGGG